MRASKDDTAQGSRTVGRIERHSQSPITRRFRVVPCGGGPRAQGTGRRAGAEVEVAVSVRDSDEQSLLLHFAVRDTGIGLTREQMS
ncbi:MAG: hypothetical protein J0L61_09325, partial [Planctomycetes bacterium]|nr:hypothetical protein [Planctomycetota bacterium]